MINSAEIFAGRILIVDDMPANILLLEDMLHSAGYTSVRSTGNSQEVCELHRKNQYDLIMLDLQMPDMDGFQVMAGLKEVEPDGNLPVLVITAQPSHKLRALKSGAKGFISKPFDLAEVLAQVHNMIEVRLLRRSAELLSSIRLENSQRIAGVGDWDYDLSDGRRIWSDEFCRILGISPGEFPPCAASFERLVHPQDLALFLQNSPVLSQGAQTSDFEHRIVRPDGQVRHLHHVTEVLVDTIGRPTHQIGIVQDITDRKNAEEALRMSEERHRTILEYSPDAYMVLQDGVITFVNQAFCRLTGAPNPALWIGRPARDVIHPDYSLMLEELMGQSLLEHNPYSEMKFVRLDGTAVDVEISNVVFDFHGQRKLQLVARDITYRKQLELHLRQAHKMEALGRLSGGIAHDFSNIIMAIGGYAELALMNLEEDAPVRAHIGAMLVASQRAGDLVRQILTFSRQETLVRIPIQLQDIVKECAGLLNGTIPASVKFELSIAADAPAVLGDASQIHRVLMNLVMNACQAMKGGPGFLKVSLEKCVLSEKSFGADLELNPGVYARISISDTGCGMSRETMQHIFEPFFTTKPPGEGTGLGLAVVHGIMESHDGAVTVHSDPGMGTVFHLYFPEHPVARAGAVGQTPHGKGERILVVDDDALLAGLCEKALASLGYEVESTTQPAEALAMVWADPRRFALVLTDQTMPGMSGMELASRLLRVRPGLPIVLMTGFTASLTAEMVMASGIRQLLQKPVDRSSMGAAINAVLRATQSPESLLQPSRTATTPEAPAAKCLALQLIP
jgi:PAS domain S-box-containing protein